MERMGEMPDEIVEDVAEDVAEASAEAHEEDVEDVEEDGAEDVEDGMTVPAALAALFGRTAKQGPTVDPALVARVVAGLDGPGSGYVVMPGHEDADGTGGYNLRAAVAEACGLAPQWFTVREREFEGAFYWRVEWRKTPRKDMSKTTAVEVDDDDDGDGEEDAGE